MMKKNSTKGYLILGILFLLVSVIGNVKKCAVGRHPKSEMLTICAG